MSDLLASEGKEAQEDYLHWTLQLERGRTLASSAQAKASVLGRFEIGRDRQLRQSMPCNLSFLHSRSPLRAACRVMSKRDGLPTSTSQLYKQAHRMIGAHLRMN